MKDDAEWKPLRKVDCKALNESPGKSFDYEPLGWLVRSFVNSFLRLDSSCGWLNFFIFLVAILLFSNLFQTSQF
jgi:hypothetical protein